MILVQFYWEFFAWKSHYKHSNNHSTLIRRIFWIYDHISKHLMGRDSGRCSDSRFLEFDSQSTRQGNRSMRRSMRLAANKERKLNLIDWTNFLAGFLLIEHYHIWCYFIQMKPLWILHQLSYLERFFKCWML